MWILFNVAFIVCCVGGVKFEYFIYYWEHCNVYHIYDIGGDFTTGDGTGDMLSILFSFIYW